MNQILKVWQSGQQSRKNQEVLALKEKIFSCRNQVKVLPKKDKTDFLVHVLFERMYESIDFYQFKFMIIERYLI